MRGKLLLLFLALGCESAPVKTVTQVLEPPRDLTTPTSETNTFGSYRVHSLYRGKNRPLSELAVFFVVSPPGHEGLGVVGRVTNLENKDDYRPPLDVTLLELHPGTYRMELWFWVGRSEFRETGAGEVGLKFESLRSAKVAVMNVKLGAGRVYYIRPDLKKTESLAPEQLERYYPLTYGASMAQVKSPPPGEWEPADYVWRPRLGELKGDDKKPFLSYR